MGGSVPTGVSPRVSGSHGYQYILVVGAFAAFLFGWGTGSNDVANAFGTSVGSGALTLNQAIGIAAIFEFLGAMVLGRVSTSVIASGIANGKVFADQPFAYSYGMMWTLMLGGIWQGWASKNGFNVSATHSIIGGIVGFALAFNGADGVIWLVDAPKSIPPVAGIVPIVVAWFFAPIATGVCSSSVFLITRSLVLRSEHSYERSFFVLPLYVVITLWINIYFVFTKGAKKTLAQGDWSDDKAAWVAICIAAGLGLMSFALLPLVRRRAEFLDNEENERNLARESRKLKDEESKNEKMDFGVSGKLTDEKSLSPEDKKNLDEDLPTAPAKKIEDVDATGESNSILGVIGLSSENFSLSGTKKYLLDFMNENGLEMKGSNERSADRDTKEWIRDYSDEIQAIHDGAEIFDSKTERVFGVLQVFSAICVMFAHGAGEVGYMAGPLATIWEVNQTGKLPKNVVAPYWILFIAAFSLVAGLATYGKKITKAVGTQFCKITPARGFAAELSTAIVIMVASQFGLPTSSSQCITGGIVGVGMVEGMGGVNWKFFAKTFASWVATLFVMGVGTGLLFTQGHTAP